MDWKTINQRFVHPARKLWEDGKPEAAEALFLAGLTATGGDGYVALNYGEFLEAQRRLAEAREQYRAALVKLPKREYKQRAKAGLDRVEAKLRAAGEQPSQGPRKIGLISCTKSKKDYPCTARELYSGSPHFREHLAFAERHYARTFIASARHGLVELHQLLSPYDDSLTDYSPEETEAWARFIAARLRREGVTAADTICIHATETYAEPLADALSAYGIHCSTVDFDSPPDPQVPLAEDP